MEMECLPVQAAEMFVMHLGPRESEISMIVALLKGFLMSESCRTHTSNLP